MLELVYRATGPIEAIDPVTGVRYIAANVGSILTPAEVEALGLKGAPRRIRTTDAAPSRQS